MSKQQTLDINALLGVRPGLHFGSRFDEAPEVLYHYTTFAGLQGILKNNRIWATNCKYLNDVNESRQVWLVLENYLRELIVARTKFSGLDLEKLLQSMSAFRGSDDFIASFSEARDMLSQWRAYSGGGPGVCIAFAGDALRTQWIHNDKGEPHWTGMQFWKVDYLSNTNPDLKEATRLLLIGESDAFMKAARDREPKLTREQEIVALLSIFSSRFKHEAFSEEREWRLTFRRHQKPMRHQQFRTSSSMMIPYIEAELNKALNKGPLIEGEYIKEIIVGPSAHTELNIQAVQQFLISLDRANIPVVPSNAPYRNW